MAEQLLYRRDAWRVFAIVFGLAPGVLALLLGFARAALRFDARKSLVPDEANAIGTALRRARPVPEPHGRNIAAFILLMPVVNPDRPRGDLIQLGPQSPVDRRESLHEAIP